MSISVEAPKGRLEDVTVYHYGSHLVLVPLQIAKALSRQALQSER